jgi:hypothetical protein
MEVQQSEREDLSVSKQQETRKEVHSNYAARLEGLNDAFTLLRQSEPGIPPRSTSTNTGKTPNATWNNSKHASGFTRNPFPRRITNRLAVSFPPATGAASPTKVHGCHRTFPVVHL